MASKLRVGPVALAAVSGLIIGVAATLGVQSWLRLPEAPPPRTSLVPLALGSETVLLPPGARVVEAEGPKRSASWAPPAAEKTRCGARASVDPRESAGAIPDGASHCWQHDTFEGGSGQGDCPVSTVCIARRGRTELTCTSDDLACEEVVAVFTARDRR
jgi:hypothetical protein